MKFSADEIASVIQQEIEQFQDRVDVREVGTVLEVGDGIARVYGLSGVMAGEMVEFQGGTRGLAFNLEENSVGVIILGDYLQIEEGEEVRSVGQLLSVPVGEAVIGRVVDPLGNPLDGMGPIDTTETRFVETIAKGVSERQPVREPLQTGLKAIDSMTPIGRGQRELIIGDRKTGKTAIAIDAIINQKNTGVKCFYVAVGQKDSSVAGVIEVLRKNGAMDYTTVIVSGASTPAPLQYVAPYAGTAMAEHFMFKGEHALIVYDDLVKPSSGVSGAIPVDATPTGPRSVSWRRVLLPQPIAGTFLEIVGCTGWRLADVATDYRNVRRRSFGLYSDQRDFHYGRTNLFAAGPFLCRNSPGHERRYLGLRVSAVRPRVKAMKKVAGGLRLDLAAFRELEAFAQLGTDLDAATQAQLDRGYRMVELLKQPQYQPLHEVDQIFSIFAGTRGFLDKVPVKST